MRQRVLTILAGLALVICASGARADNGEHLIEVGAVAGLQAAGQWDAGAWGGESIGVDAKTSLLFIDLAAAAQFEHIDTGNAIEVSAHGSAMLVQIQDLYYRSNPSTGNMERAFAGLGADRPFALPGGWMRITASVGAAAMKWGRPMEDDQSFYGGYVGGAVALHLWKIGTEVRVAYAATPEISNSAATGTNTSLSNWIQSWRTALIGSARVGFDVIQFSGFNVGPEVRAEFESLPDGTEWFATVGVAGRWTH